MWFLVIDNCVVGQVETQREVYGAILHYIRQRTSAAPSLVRDFGHIVNPQGVYYVKKEGVYTVRVYVKEGGIWYDCYNYTDEFTIHVSEFDNTQKSALKASYLEAVKQKLLLKPVLERSPNA
jgi:hypothetical protein